MSEGESVKKKSKDRERHNCCVPSCSVLKTKDNHLHVVPKDPVLRHKWAIAIRTGKKLSDKMSVCSNHFQETDYIRSRCGAKFRRLKRNVVPSQRLPQRTAERVVSSPVKRRLVARDERAKKRAVKIVTSQDSNLQSVDNSCICDGSADTAVTSTAGAGGGTTDAEWQDMGEIQADDQAKFKSIGIQVDVDSGQAGIFSSILNCDKKLFSVTGLHSVKLLNSITQAFEKLAPPSPFCSFLMSTRDRIILTMMKIKLAISFSSLAALFDLSIQTCSNYFYDSVIVLAKILKCVIVWPDKEKILKNMPKCFKNYKCTRAILDAYEIPVEKPKCIQCRIRLYSHYKKNFTAKIMMICAPSGLITNCSSSFGGRASDKVVTKETGIYNLCEPNDGLMVDKGFDIDSECQDNLLQLIRPPFLRSKTRKFTRAESVQCAKIARARVHVERVIQRVREYHILKFKVPWTLCPYLDDIVIIVSALVNLGKPILASDKF